MSEWPPVSVVIPYAPDYTPAELLERAKDSVALQDPPTDLIVVEDTDANGPSWARNRGIERADNHYIALLDADDEWHEGKLAAQLDRMNETGAGLCVQGEEMPTEAFIRELYLGNIESLTSSILIDTEQVDVRFAEHVDRREDHLFMLEAAAQGGVCLVPDLFSVGTHDESYSSGLTHYTRLKKDVAFAREARQRVPEIRRYVNSYYRRPRCRTEPVRNTPGDLFRMGLIRASPVAMVVFLFSLACQWARAR